MSVLPKPALGEVLQAVTAGENCKKATNTCISIYISLQRRKKERKSNLLYNYSHSETLLCFGSSRRCKRTLPSSSKLSNMCEQINSLRLFCFFIWVKIHWCRAFTVLIFVFHVYCWPRADSSSCTVFKEEMNSRFRQRCAHPPLLREGSRLCVAAVIWIVASALGARLLVGVAKDATVSDGLNTQIVDCLCHGLAIQRGQ